ncbi:carbamate kinase [Streptomyces cupreus]|uniref:Carbamate kinase n=1 Tax=Streptomyces cupreus TaxID=2759956 RepID=A0A7X1MAI1_9ACTN|nr:carbamate kinase [Streptomyces cupreus]MBC2904162.1 carbamate kinase [Streptomyces cupreus]
MRIVVCLGGNALLRPGERRGGRLQDGNLERVATALAPLAHEHELAITHGNGPRSLAPAPPDVGCAEAQGVIGTLLVRALRDALPGRRIVSLLTHTLVRADDPAFTRPAGRGRLPVPDPEVVLEADTVRELLDLGTLVLCGGGGGIPVVAARSNGALRGVAAVDKDLTAARLAQDVKADFLLILTDVPNVHDGHGTPHQRPVLDATPSELRAAHYAEDSMGPKAEAAARFVEHGGLAAIGALDAAYDIVHGRSGTLVRPDLPVA